MHAKVTLDKAGRLVLPKPIREALRIGPGDTLEIELLAVEAGQPVTFDRVLLINNDGKIAVGSPTVASATVVADVVEHIRGEKKIAYKMKRRKGFRKTIGSRAELTVVKIKEIKA